jgi:apolipoprotein N-acyltransferase
VPYYARLLAAALCGGGVYAGFPPHGWIWLLGAGLVGLTFLLQEQTPRAAAGVGFAFGLGFMGPLLVWLSVLGPDVWLLVAIASAGFYALFGWAYGRTRALPAHLLWATALWVGMEYLRSQVPFGGFPWGRLAFATADTPLVSFNRWVGVAGTSGLIFLGCCAVGIAVHHALGQGVGRRLAYAAAVPAGLVVAGLALPTGLASATGSATVAAVQGDVPGTGAESLGERHEVTTNHAEATVAYAEQVRAGERPKPDLVIWPENSTDVDPFTTPSIGAEIDEAVKAIGVPTLIGAIVDGPGSGEAQNVGLVWDPEQGSLPDRYVKRHLVPFGEYIPLRDQLAPLISRLDQIARDMQPGDEPGVLQVGPVLVGTMMCFDVAYDDTIADNASNGAELMVVQTNNATYYGTAQPEQQWGIEQVRAVETGRDVVVASVNGISGFVSADGEVLQRTHSRDQQVLVQDVRLADGLTWGVRFGAWIERGLALLGAGAVVAALVLARRRREPADRVDEAADSETPDDEVAAARPDENEAPVPTESPR